MTTLALNVLAFLFLFHIGFLILMILWELIFGED